MTGFSDRTEQTGETAPAGLGETEEGAEKSARGVVRRAALAAALAGIFPIPLGGIAGVPALQAKMLVRLAKTFGRTLHWKEARNLAGLLGGATALQTLCRLFTRTAARAIPAAGLAAGAASAFGSTFALGQVAIRYFRPAPSGSTTPPGSDAEGFEREARTLRLEWEAGAISEETYRRDLETLRKGLDSARKDAEG
jgi:uncharacterized protein (DUF697 family)